MVAISLKSENVCALFVIIWSQQKNCKRPPLGSFSFESNGNDTYGYEVHAPACQEIPSHRTSILQRRLQLSKVKTEIL